MTYKIKPLHLGTIIRKKSNMLWHCGSDAPTAFPLIAFLLEGDGTKLLVDTGGSTPNGVNWMPYERTAEQELTAALAMHDTKPEEIDAVLFTHLHWDHAGNNAFVPRARMIVQKSEYLPIQAGEQPGYERNLILQSKYELLDGDTRDVFPGISVMLTPGHSVGSQSILVNTANGTSVIAGDLIPTYENITRKLPNGGNYDVDIIRESMDRVCALGVDILPGHDMKVLGR